MFEQVPASRRKCSRTPKSICTYQTCKSFPRWAQRHGNISSCGGHIGSDVTMLLLWPNVMSIRMQQIIMKTMNVNKFDISYTSRFIIIFMSFHAFFSLDIFFFFLILFLVSRTRFSRFAFFRLSTLFLSLFVYVFHCSVHCTISTVDWFSSHCFLVAVAKIRMLTSEMSRTKSICINRNNFQCFFFFRLVETFDLWLFCVVIYFCK